MIIYGIKNCNTMQKAFAWLEENGVAYTFHDYKSKGITEQKLNEWLKKKPLLEIVNTKGTTYKQLSDSEKLAMADISKAISLIIQKPSMIKRPIAETKNEITLGFDPDYWDQHV